MRLMSWRSSQGSSNERLVQWAIVLWAIVSSRLAYERWFLWAKGYERKSYQRSSYEPSSVNSIFGQCYLIFRTKFESFTLHRLVAQSAQIDASGSAGRKNASGRPQTGRSNANIVNVERMLYLQPRSALFGPWIQIAYLAFGTTKSL